MSRIQLSTIQEDLVEDRLRQGNTYILPLTYLQQAADWTKENKNMELQDIAAYSYFAQIRQQPADRGGEAFYTFSSAPDVNNSYFTKDTASAKVTFYFSDELTRSMRPGSVYYFEVKTQDASGNNIKSFLMSFFIEPEYAR